MIFCFSGTGNSRYIARRFVEAAIASIQAGRKFPAPRNNMGYRIMSGIINPFFYRLIVKADPFRVSDACVGCGQCASKCPLNNIELRNGKPRYRFEELEDLRGAETFIVRTILVSSIANKRTLEKSEFIDEKANHAIWLDYN